MNTTPRHWPRWHEHRSSPGSRTPSPAPRHCPMRSETRSSSSSRLTRIRAEARRQQARKDAGEELPLFGTLVSVKDLFDEAGQVTSAGSRLLADRAPATRDAVSVARLRGGGRADVRAHLDVGIRLFRGRAEPASRHPVERAGDGRDPGRLELPAARWAWALGLTDAAIGTDTGGSLRIPAAANGHLGDEAQPGTDRRHGRPSPCAEL